jgi:excisionase family DNA binding protein
METNVMSQLINFSEFSPAAKPALAYRSNNANLNHVVTGSIALTDNIAMLRERYPKQILFTMKEVAMILKVSYSLVQQYVASGQIQSVEIGKRKQINFHELSKILSKGVQNEKTN